MLDSSDRPLSLEEALKEIETLNLPPERKALLQAELHLVAGEAKAMETLKNHFQNSAKTDQQSTLNFDELTSLNETTAVNGAKLRSTIEAASLSFCGECTTVSGLPGKWIFINPTTKLCKPC